MATSRTIKFRFPIKESADWALWDLFESSDCVATYSLIREFTTNNIYKDAQCTVHQLIQQKILLHDMMPNICDYLPKKAITTKNVIDLCSFKANS